METVIGCVSFCFESLACSSCTGEYWPLDVFVRTERREVAERSVLPRPRANISQYGLRARIVRGRLVLHERALHN